MVAQVFLEAQGVVAGQGLAAPFHFPGFEWFGAFEIAFVMPYEFGLGVLGLANEAAVHAVDEEIDLIVFFLGHGSDG